MPDGRDASAAGPDRWAMEGNRGGELGGVGRGGRGRGGDGAASRPGRWRSTALPSAATRWCGGRATPPSGTSVGCRSGRTSWRRWPRRSTAWRRLQTCSPSGHGRRRRCSRPPRREGCDDVGERGVRVSVRSEALAAAAARVESLADEVRGYAHRLATAVGEGAATTGGAARRRGRCSPSGYGSRPRPPGSWGRRGCGVRRSPSTPWRCTCGPRRGCTPRWRRRWRR